MAAGGRPRSTEVLQVLVVHKDADRVSCSLHMNPPLLECRHDSQQLLVVDRIIELCKGKHFVIEADGV